MTDRPPRYPSSGVIGCTVSIDGVTVSDGGPGTSPLDPTVLSGLSIRWGRTTTVDQPPPATCALSLLDLPGDQAFLDVVRVGARVDVTASATVWPDDPTESVYADDGSAMRSDRATITRHQSDPAAWSIVADAAVDTAAVSIPPAPPVPPGQTPEAWDAIPTTSVGQTWKVSASVWAPPGATLTLTPTLWSGPWRPTERVVALAAPPRVTGGAIGRWQTLSVEFDPAEAGRWVGMRLVVEPTGHRWDDLATAWDDVPYVWTWDYLDTAAVTDMAILAPAAGTVRTVAVFAGRVTDATARYERRVGGSIVDVQAQDFTADLANAYIGGEPWPAESAAARIRRILAAAAPDVTLIPAPRPAAMTIAARDVDRQPAAQLIAGIASSVDGIVRAAVHPTTGPYLELEDPAGRAALLRLVLDPGGLVMIEPSGAVDGSVVVSADWLDLDPVRWIQDVADVVSRVTIDWLDASTSPPTQRTIVETDADRVADVGERTASLSSQLTTAADARAIAAQLLARLDLSAWRLSGLRIDTSSVDLDPDVVDLVLTLLDGTARIGLPLTVTGTPEWTPSPATDPGAYVEGGTYAYIDGCWTLSLDTSTPNGLGKSAAWDDLDEAWPWDIFDPDIAWDDLTGVGA